MKEGDYVSISIDGSETIPKYNREEIKKNPFGYIYKIHSTYFEIRTCLGIWEFKKEKVKGVEKK